MCVCVFLCSCVLCVAVFCVFGFLWTNDVCCIFKLSGNDFEASMECLLAGPTSESIVKLTESKYERHHHTKVHIDEDEAWCDLVSFYKAPMPDCRVRICLTGQPAIDTGGIRRQLSFSSIR